MARKDEDTQDASGVCRCKCVCARAWKGCGGGAGLAGEPARGEFTEFALTSSRVQCSDLWCGVVARSPRLRLVL